MHDSEILCLHSNKERTAACYFPSSKPKKHATQLLLDLDANYSIILILYFELTFNSNKNKCLH